MRLGALYRNPRTHSSGKTGEKALVLAADLARQVGMVPTWPNVQTIRLAIESEAELSAASLAEAAEIILQSSKEFSRGRYVTCPPEWEARELFRHNSIDRFWFEDARWRVKAIYQQWVEKLRESA